MAGSDMAASYNEVIARQQREISEIGESLSRHVQAQRDANERIIRLQREIGDVNTELYRKGKELTETRAALNAQVRLARESRDPHDYEMEINDLKLELAHKKGVGSVLRPWVMALPLREQGALLTGIRGCDTVNNTFYWVTDTLEREKSPGWNALQHPTKLVVRMLRYAICNPADDREVGAQQGFMADWRVEDFQPASWPAKCLDDLPLHFVTHLLHAIEVVAYRHPDLQDQDIWRTMYLHICDHLHIVPERPEDMVERLGEDRIARGTVKPSSNVILGRKRPGSMSREATMAEVAGDEPPTDAYRELHASEYPGNTKPYRVQI